MGTVSTRERASVHPLDLLSAEEIESAATILRQSNPAFAAARFVSIGLDEPPKEQVLAHADGDRIDRRAFLVVRDSTERKTYEAVVSLSEQQGCLARARPRGTDGADGGRLRQCRAHAQGRRALAGGHAQAWCDRLRARHDRSLACGYLNDEDAPTRRLNRPLTYVRHSEDENGYAHPVEGLLALLDLDRGEVLDVVDHGVIDIPAAPATTRKQGCRPRATSRTTRRPRADLKPLEITQPEGPSFEVDGYQVRWQKWRFLVGFNAREGLTLHTSATRTTAHAVDPLSRVAHARWSCPTATRRPTQVRKNAFDVGEYGMGVWPTA